MERGGERNEFLGTSTERGKVEIFSWRAITTVSWCKRRLKKNWTLAAHSAKKKQCDSGHRGENEGTKGMKRTGRAVRRQTKFKENTECGSRS